MRLAGIDIGTTGAKATVFDAKGRIIARAYREYPLTLPKPGWVELDAERVIRDAHDALAEAAAHTRRDPVTALSVSVLGEAAAPVDKNGRPVARAIAGFDTRGADECRELVDSIGVSRLHRITGAPPNHTFTICKIMWLKRNRPTLFRRAHKFLLFEDLFIRSLGLQPAIDYSLAARSMAFDIHKMKWSDEILDAAGLDAGLFAAPSASGTALGEVSNTVANKLGLRRGVIVATGAHDQIAGALGCGVVEPGLACDSTGTVECVTAALSRATVNSKMLNNNFCCSPHAIPGMYATLAFNYTGGALLRWFRDVFGDAEKTEAERTGRDVYDILLAKAAKKPTALHVLPHFTTSGTPRFDPDAFGAIVGLGFGTTRAEFIRALLEGVTLEIRMNLELLRGAGVEVRELEAIGGGARSPFWLQLKADVFDRPVAALDVSEAGGLGAAILAGLATGIYKSHREAAAATVRRKKLYIPNKECAEFYTRKLAAHTALYPALKKWKSHDV